MKGSKQESAKARGKSKKKTPQVPVISVIGEKRPNKHRSYLNITYDEKKGVYQIGSSDGEDVFYMGTHNLDLTVSVASQVLQICSLGNKTSEVVTENANASMAAILEIDPQDSTELMLAAQMVTVHNLTMEMSRRALLSEQTEDGVNFNINRTTKLMRTYMAQMEALNKYRNKGKQQITVQHVNVNDGGQAVIGDVSQGVGNK